MEEREHSFDEAKKALNKARRNNKISIVIWIVYIVVMVALAIAEGVTGHWGSMINTGCLIILAVYIILLHRSRGKDYIMLDESMNLIEHMFTSHKEYVEHVESINTWGGRSAEACRSDAGMRAAAEYAQAASAAPRPPMGSSRGAVGAARTHHPTAYRKRYFVLYN